MSWWDEVLIAFGDMPPLFLLCRTFPRHRGHQGRAQFATTLLKSTPDQVESEEWRCPGPFYEHAAGVNLNT